MSTPTGTPLPSFPTGWYAVCASNDLPPGGVIARTVCGRDLAVYRTTSGLAVAVDAACPHLGAHLGHSARVEGETLRCGFHGFQFDGSGACIATGYGVPPPRKCALVTWPVDDANGYVLVYFDPEGRAPTWRIPVAPTGEGWTRTRTKHIHLRAHVQDLAENSVDIGHLSWVHGYRDITPLADVVTAGSVLRARYSFRHPRGILGVGVNARAEIDISVHGLGYSQVEVVVPQLGFRSRQFVLATPADGEHIDLRIGMCLTRLSGARGPVPRVLARLPHAVFNRLVARVAFDAFAEDVEPDVRIWSTKRYLSAPQLVEGDGPIGRYRRWARQFYTEGARTKRVSDLLGQHEVPADVPR